MARSGSEHSGNGHERSRETVLETVGKGRCVHGKPGDRGESRELLVAGGMLIDPALGKPVRRNLVIRGGRVVDLTRRATPKDELLRADGCWICPGFVDLHAHLREPGQTHKETIATGLAAAVRGGFTAVAAMPNTQPACDNVEVLSFILSKAAEADTADLVPVCRITCADAPDERVAMEELVRAGCRGFSNDGAPVEKASVMLAALREAQRLGIAVLDHCEDPTLTAGGVIQPGERADAWGLPGLSPLAEEIHVARDLLLAAQTGCPIHLCHLSTSRGVDLLRLAKRWGAPVSAEACPHHFALSVDHLREPDPDFKMNPPLRSEHDRQALLEGLCDGTIEVIATDHAPHAVEEKAQGFRKAPFGVVGLETAVSLCLDRLVNRGVLSPAMLVRALAVRPAQILGLEARCLEPGNAAHVTVLDPDGAVTVDRSVFVGRSRNTPFHGMSLKGRVRATLVRGRVKFHDRQ